MNYNLEIQKLLLESEKMTNPEDRIANLKQAIKIADANNDIDWGFDLRMDLIRDEQYTNHSMESFPAFAWILDAYDNNPDLFSENEILLEYKWLASVAYSNLNVSKPQIEAILEDFRERAIRNGYSSREYYNIKVNICLLSGDKEGARIYLDLRDKEPQDAMSSLWNDTITTIFVELIEKNFESAISHIKEFTTQHSTHHMSPIPVYSGLIYYLGGKHYDPIIEKYFEIADEEFSKMTKYPFQLYEMSLIMYYMAKHRKEKAWSYFEDFINWEPDAEDAVRFDFALSILPLLKNGGIKKIDSIGSRLPYYRDDNTYNLDELYQYYRHTATDLAERFDIRNGNNHFTQQLNEELNKL